MADNVSFLPNLFPWVPFSNLESLPDISAVYLAIAPDTSVLYIGATKHLNRRWQNHHHYQILERLQCQKVAYFKCLRHELADIEEAMIAQFVPPLNHQSSFRYRDNLLGQRQCSCPDWLADAWRDLVRTPGISARHLAKALGLSLGTIYSFCRTPTNNTAHHRCSRISHLITATLITGHPVLIRALTQHTGLSTPSILTPSGKPTHVLLREIVDEIGSTIKLIGPLMFLKPIPTKNAHQLEKQLAKLHTLADDFSAGWREEQNPGQYTLGF